MMFKILTLPSTIWATVSTLLIPLYILNPVRPIPFDVDVVYSYFFDSFLQGEIFGITEEWVYPAAAIVPIILAGFLGFFTNSFLSGWVLLVASLNFATIMWVGVKKNLTHKHFAVMMVFALSLSGIFYYRLDFIALCLTVWAYMLVGRNKQLAYFIIIFAALIKIWPAALAVGIWLTSSSKTKDAFLLALYSFVLLLPSIVFGGWQTAFSFITGQTARAIQIESAYAIPLFINNDRTYFNSEIMAREISGTLSQPLSVLSTVMLISTLVIVLIIGLTKYWKTPASWKESNIIVSIIIVSFILFNKVGSPQFSIWLLLVLILMFNHISRNTALFYTFLAGVSALAAGILYPYIYTPLASGETWAVAILTVKHFSMAVLWVLLVARLVKSWKQELKKGLVSA